MALDGIESRNTEQDTHCNEKSSHDIREALFMLIYTLFDCLDLALDNKHMLAGLCNVDDKTKGSKLVDH